MSEPLLRSEKQKKKSRNVWIMRISTSWLEKFRIMHKINIKSILGVCKCQSYRCCKLYETIIHRNKKNYEERYISNADKTWLFFRAFRALTWPDKRLNLKSEKCRKMAKEGLTILHCRNMAGAKEKRVVINKAARAFGKISERLLPATWLYWKTWLTGDVTISWLNQYDWKMGAQNRIFF